MSEDNARPAKRPLRHLPSIRPLSWSSTISSVAVRTPDFCPGDLRLAPNGAPVTTHERIGRPKRCPKTKSKKAANAIKTGMDFVSCLANRGRLRWNVRALMEGYGPFIGGLASSSNKRPPYGGLPLGYNG